MLALGQRFRYQTLATLAPGDVAQFRDERMAAGCAGATVIKQLNVLARVIDTAGRDWGIHAPQNPARLVSRPAAAPGRSRRLSAAEQVALFDWCRKSRARGLDSIAELALETAMRLGALDWHEVDLEQRTARLLMTKNGAARTVPLSSRAVAVLRALEPKASGRVFPNWKDTLNFEHSWHRAMLKSGLDCTGNNRAQDFANAKAIHAPASRGPCVPA